MDSIVADELRWVAEANALRAQHKQQMWVLYGLFLLLPVVALVLVVISGLRDRVRGIPRTLSEPPEPLAVEAAFLFAQLTGASPANAYRAQLLRLVRIGAVELRTEGMVTDPKDITFVKRKGPGEMQGTDREFMELLFGAATDADALEEVSIAHPPPRRLGGPGPARYRTWLEDSKKDVSMAMINIEKGDARFESVTLGLLVMFSIGFATWGATAGRVGPVGLWLIPWALLWLMIGLRNIVARVDLELRERLARLLAFRRYLVKFSTLPDAPAAAVLIWEEYLEWAVALGVADEVEKQVRALLPVEALTKVWPQEVASSPMLLRNLSPVATSLVTHASTTVSASGSSSGGFGSSSSSSGSSGGFSGGGGGGGGGSGGGAG